ncbi:ChaN family lipoprotein [Desulfuromonas carbonis]|uniref:ChaN family lipoprotein n=1 Tax=Desulfuromonas sp. DDH964 TaxID=1823759 RepID=UPI00083457D0|nr:ChaN family lipoprotein [Desulfuromonas sp. DDH964]
MLLSPLQAGAHTWDVNQGQFTTFPRMLADLANARLVFIGELHDNRGHHQAQLQIIRGLQQAGIPVAIGLEMFRSNSQEALDRWTAGGMKEDRFREVFEENWSLWPVYRDIFQYARQETIPMIGLNIPREISRQVSQAGFFSLSPSQRGSIPLVRCDVDEAYQNYMRRVLGSHAHQGVAFKNFCEAQMVWDAVMAKRLIEYLDQHPQRLVVVLAGSGHAWKFGIPEQVRRHLDIPMRIVLPEIPGRIEKGDAAPSEADYLLLGPEEGPLH